MDLMADPAFLGSVFSMLILGIIVSVAAAIIYVLMKSR